MARLLYVDVDGKAISQRAWKRLYRTPGYGEPLSFLHARHEVRLSWIGVYSTRESMPGVWMVQHIEVDQDGKIVWEDHLCYPTRQLALASYQACCDTVCQSGGTS